MTTGNISAATPILFMNAESTPVVTMITRIICGSLFPATRSTCLPIMSATPVALRPALRINIDQTVTTAGLLKPARAPSRVTSLVTPSALRTRSATTSMRSFSVINRTSAIARMMRTAAISTVIERIGFYCSEEPFQGNNDQHCHGL